MKLKIGRKYKLTIKGATPATAIVTYKGQGPNESGFRDWPCRVHCATDERMTGICSPDELSELPQPKRDARGRFVPQPKRDARGRFAGEPPKKGDLK